MLHFPPAIIGKPFETKSCRTASRSCRGLSTLVIVRAMIVAKAAISWSATRVLDWVVEKTADLSIS